MAMVSASAALAAVPALSASVLTQRIIITPGNFAPGGLGVYGPLATDSWVQAPGLSDGVYDT